MCVLCEADEAEPSREIYLARRARIARTWAPRRPWLAEALPASAVSPAPPRGVEPIPRAVE
jgi:hypothetical protein